MKSGSFPHNLGRGEKFVFFAIVGTAGVIVFGTLFGLLVQFLWNATLVELFGIAEITFWQSIGVLVLAKLFFGFGSSGGSSSKSKKKKKSDESAEVESSDEELMKQAAFRDYWEQEGRDAYDAFRSGQDKTD